MIAAGAVLVVAIVCSISWSGDKASVCHEAEYSETIDDQREQLEQLDEAQRDLDEVRVHLKADDVAGEIKQAK